MPRDAVAIETTRTSFVASSKVALPDDGGSVLVMVDASGRLTQTPLGADGRLPAFDPFAGGSSFGSGGAGSCRVVEA